MKLNIPAGVDTGTNMRLAGEGQASTSGGPAGDLYVVLRVRDHAFFERQENDLHCTIPISITQAVLGAEISFDSFDGEETLRIPEGTQPGTRFRIRGRGVPRVNSSGRGDLYVHIEVRVPERLTKEQRRLFEQLSETQPGDGKPREKGLIDKVLDYFS
jgi:molecular chaperone DnaJ